MFVSAALRMWRVFSNKGSASSMLKLWDVVARVLEAGWVVQLCVFCRLLLLQPAVAPSVKIEIFGACTACRKNIRPSRSLWAPLKRVARGTGSHLRYLAVSLAPCPVVRRCGEPPAVHFRIFNTLKTSFLQRTR